LWVEEKRISSGSEVKPQPGIFEGFEVKGIISSSLGFNILLWGGKEVKVWVMLWWWWDCLIFKIWLLLWWRVPRKNYNNECKIVTERVKLREPSLAIRIKNLTMKECKIG